VNSKLHIHILPCRLTVNEYVGQEMHEIITIAVIAAIGTTTIVLFWFALNNIN